jgi:hypothetical protein
LVRAMSMVLKTKAARLTPWLIFPEEVGMLMAE